MQQQVASYSQPVQIFEVDEVIRKVDQLTAPLRRPQNLHFAVKSFPHEPLLRAVAERGVGFEVSNLVERRLLPAQVAGRTIAVNSPGLLDEHLFDDESVDYILHLDSDPQTMDLSKLPQARLGLRLNFRDIPARNPSADDTAPFERFGVPWSTFLESYRAFRDGVFSGVHFHNPSECNSAGSYRNAVEVITRAVADHGVPLEFVSVGGGFHAVADGEVTSLLTDLQEMLGSTDLFIEPGHVAANGAGYLLCSVVSVRRVEDGLYFVGVDASYGCHARWSQPRWSGLPGHPAHPLPYREPPTPVPGETTVAFTGASCNNSDRLGVFSLPSLGGQIPLDIGSPIVFSNINGYSFAWNSSFNGIPKAAVEFINRGGEGQISR